LKFLRIEEELKNKDTEPPSMDFEAMLNTTKHMSKLQRNPSRTPWSPTPK